MEKFRITGKEGDKCTPMGKFIIKSILRRDKKIKILF